MCRIGRAVHRHARSAPSRPACDHDGSMSYRLGADVPAFLRWVGGAARVADVQTAGHDRSAVRRALSDGEAVRVSRGVLALPEADALAVAAVVHGCRATCLSAARTLGLWTLSDPVEPHLWSVHGRFPPGCVRHRGPLLGAALPAGGGSGPVVPVLDAVIHTIRCRPALEALVVAESAVRLRLLDRRQLAAALPGNRNGAARAVVGRIGEGSESPLEIVARELFVSAGLRVEPQVPLDGVGRVDLLVEGRVVVELDGFEFHGTSRAAFRRDRRRGNAAMLGGLPTLRYTYEDVMYDAERIVDEVLSLARRRSCGAP